MNQQRPRVSIGLPVYNGEKYLAQCLESLLAQTFCDFEIIICDNASTDRTQRLAESFAQRDPRISYFRNDANLGVSGNYRRSFDLSSGEFFKWVAYDDLTAPELLARSVEVLDLHPDSVLVYPKTKLIDEDGNFLSDYEDNLHLQSDLPSERFKQLQRNLRLCNAMFGLIRTRSLKKTALMADYVASDINLLGELTLHGKFWEIPEYLFYRRLHAAASSSMKEDRELLNYLEPLTAQSKPNRLTEWRRHWDYLSAITRSPIGLHEKARCGIYLLRMAVWNRRQLGAELSSRLRRGWSAPKL